MLFKLLQKKQILIRVKMYIVLIALRVCWRMNPSMELFTLKEDLMGQFITLLVIIVLLLVIYLIIAIASSMRIRTNMNSQFKIRIILTNPEDLLMW